MFLKKKNIFPIFFSYSLLSFLITIYLFLLFFSTKNFIKNKITLFLNVIQREINYFIRGNIRDIQIPSEYSVNSLFDNLLNTFFKIFQGTEINIYIIIFLFSFLFIEIFFKKNRFENNFLIIDLFFYNILIYLIFFIFIRHSPRLFITFYPIFFILIVVSVYYFFNNLKFNSKKIIVFLILSVYIFFNFYQNFPSKFKHEIQSTKLIFNYFKDKIDQDNKILILSSVEMNIPHLILEKSQNNKPFLFSENYHLASNAYFSNNAIIFYQFLNYDNLETFSLFLKKNKIKYIVFDPSVNKEIPLNIKATNNIYNLFPNNLDIIENFFKRNSYNLKKYQYLKLYRSDLNYSILNTTQEIKLIETFFKKKNLKKINPNTFFYKL